MILVTGGTGFIGSHLVEHLLARGEEIRVLTRNPSKLSRLGIRGVDVAVGDIADRTAVAEAMRGVNRVYHLAALFRHGADPQIVWRTNYAGTINVVEEAANRGARLLHVSTVGVMGPASSKPLDERAPYNPNPNPYSRSKAEAERYVLEACRSRGLDAVVIRPAFVYGPRGTYGLNMLIRMVAEGKLKVVIGRGDNYIHPIHVRDLTSAIVTAMEKGKSGEVYIAANEEPTKLRKLLDLVAQLAGVKLHYGLPPPLAYLILRLRGGIGGASAKETLMAFTKNWFYSVNKLLSLGWKQKISIEEGIKETLNWLQRKTPSPSQPSFH